MKVDITKSAMENCSRFNKCNINACPLHKDYLKKLKNCPEDYAVVHKEKCIPKKTRIEIARHYNLKNRGMTPKELIFTEKWEKLSPEEKERRKQRLRKVSPFLKLKRKGYIIHRDKQYKGNLTLPKSLKQAENRVLEANSKENQIKIEDFEK